MSVTAFHIFSYVYFIPALLLWSLLQDDIISGRLGWGLSAAMLYIFGTLAVVDDKENAWFVIFWVVGSAVLIVIPFAWNGSYNISWWIPATALLVLALLNAGRVYSQKFESLSQRKNIVVPSSKNSGLIEQRALATAFGAYAVFFLFVGLQTDGIIPSSNLYSAVLYILVAALPADVLLRWRSMYILRVAYLLLIWALLSISTIMLARRWTNTSAVPFYLIIQPAIGVCFVQSIRYIRESRQKSTSMH